MAVAVAARARAAVPKWAAVRTWAAADVGGAEAGGGEAGTGAPGTGAPHWGQNGVLIAGCPHEAQVTR